jgi:hypothetical protein
MQLKRNLMALLMVCSVSLMGAARSAAQDVQVGIQLPYGGNYNFWNIQFYDTNGFFQFDLNTNNSTYTSQVLGTVPAGRYRVEFWGNYDGVFDFGFAGPSGYDWAMGQSPYQFYNVTIEEGTTLYIDKL